MGVVYRAEDTRLGRSVALKFLSPQLSRDKRARARMEREARAASALDHPNICTVYEIGEADDGRLYLALACYDGETLERVIEHGPLEVEEAVRIAVQMARGLAAAHRQGIVHRDVKPSNVLITDEGEVKLLDFGIARVAGSDLTGTGDTLGTAAYMSPEQLRGQPDPRSDVWALGVVLYETLAGERPFRADYAAALQYAILHHDPPPLESCREDVPEALLEVVERCLDKELKTRYQSAEEVVADLERMGRSASATRSTRRVFRRNRSLVLGLGGVVLIGAFLLSPLRPLATEGLGLGGAPDLEHLAVFPFDAPGAEVSVGEGLAQELTRQLAQLGASTEPQIRVVSSSESGAVATPAEAHGQFGVGAVVSGELRRGDERDDLIVRLIDARTSRLIKSARLSEPKGRLPVLQRRALTLVAEMVGAPLSSEDIVALHVGGTSDSEALSFYWSAMGYLERFDMAENVGTAIELFNRAIERDPSYAGALAGLSEAYGLKYKATRDPQWVPLAESNARRAVAVEDMFGSAHVALGNVYALKGRYSDAIREMNLAVELNSLDASAYVGLANAYRSVGRYGDAEENFQRAIELQPNAWSHHNQLGKLYLASGRVGAAAKKFEEVTASAPDNAWGFANLCAAYLYLNETAKAKANCIRANDIQPTAYAYSNLGTVAYYEGDLEGMARMYSLARDLDSLDYAIWGNLGSSYRRLGREGELVESAYQRAIELVERVLVVNPSNPEYLSDLSAYAVEVGDVERARQAIDRAVALAPHDTIVLIRAAKTFEEMGERKEALYWISRALAAGYSEDELQADPSLDILREDPDYKALTGQ